MKVIGRKEPYTEIGISRIKCTRCGQSSDQQWQVCANKNRYCGLCDDCDIALNEMVLKFMKIPHAKKLMKFYKKLL